MLGNNYLLWENDEFIVKTPYNPHQPYAEGLHIVVAPKREVETAWEDPELAGRAFKLAAQVSQVIERCELAPWLNLQANGNWGLLPGATPFFHIHIYGRNKTNTWAQPITLPQAPKTYHNDPMPDVDRHTLTAALSEALL